MLRTRDCRRLMCGSLDAGSLLCLFPLDGRLRLRTWLYMLRLAAQIGIAVSSIGAAGNAWWTRMMSFFSFFILCQFGVIYICSAVTGLAPLIHRESYTSLVKELIAVAARLGGIVTYDCRTLVLGACFQVTCSAYIFVMYFYSEISKDVFLLYHCVLMCSVVGSAWITSLFLLVIESQFRELAERLDGGSWDLRVVLGVHRALLRACRLADTAFGPQFLATSIGCMVASAFALKFQFGFGLLTQANFMGLAMTTVWQTTFFGLVLRSDRIMRYDEKFNRILHRIVRKDTTGILINDHSIRVRLTKRCTTAFRFTALGVFEVNHSLIYWMVSVCSSSSIIIMQFGK